MLPFLAFSSANPTLARAFRIAVGDLHGNLVRFRQGRLAEPAICLAAGADYDTPWTRDMALNTWSGFGLIAPEIARNSLRAVQEEDGAGGWRIGGQYWDAVIWAEGAWQLYLFTGDRAWLAEAAAVTRAGLIRFEAEEFDEGLGLFRGPAFFQDGIAGYPDEYSTALGSDVRDWVKTNPGRRAAKGFGIPWMALSTNCLYVNAYRRLDDMRAELGLPAEPRWRERGEALAATIRARYWNPATRRFDYLIAPWGRCDHQETAGHAFLLLFGIADEEQRAAILTNTTTVAAGAPCVWPTFPRYAAYGANAFGRHSGTVWPQVQGLWADAALRAGRPERFFHELRTLSKHAVRDGQFTEIYHPHTGAVYGGVQEHWEDSHLREWHSVARMAWSATALLRMVFYGLFGMRFATDGVRFAPVLDQASGPIALEGLPYRGATLNLRVDGTGSRIVKSTVNGVAGEPVVPTSARGTVAVAITVG
jgi:hypothetical protein